MVATVRCEEIAWENFNQLTHDEVHSAIFYFLYASRMIDKIYCSLLAWT